MQRGESKPGQKSSRQAERKSDPNSPPPTEVAVLVDTCTGWGRRLIRGIASYANKHGPWHVLVEPSGREEVMRLPKGWGGNGIIARVFNQGLADDLAATGIPVVNVSSIRLPRCSFPRVASDFRATAALAFEHFVERGFRHFGYIGPFSRRYVQPHAEAFRSRVREAGADFHPFNFFDSATSNRHRAAARERLTDWLDTVPKPIGIFSWATTAGSYALALCRDLNIVVPDELAVLAGDSDPLLCNLTIPPMSGLVIASEQVGYQAAGTLAKLMAGESIDETEKLVEPVRIDSRASTEVLAIADEELRNAVAYLREHAFEMITIDEVADEAAISRRQFERKFREWFGRAPAEELRRLRLARVQELLVQTDLTVSEIAWRSGFGSLEYMSTRFKAVTGMTPLRYRSTMRAR